MKCEFCKSEITDINAKFCPACGGKIERQVIPENVTSVSRTNELLVSKIQEYFSSRGAIKNIFAGKNIPRDAFSRYGELSKDEEPLVLVNAESAFFSGYTGILITKTRLHYIAQKKGFGGTFLGSGEELSGSVSLKIIISSSAKKLLLMTVLISVTNFTLTENSVGGFVSIRVRG